MKARERVRRWFVFNGVGALGVVVQLAVLAALVRWTGMHYLAATTLAVEAAVLHNFVWHQRWTWCDRPVSVRRAILWRLGRFHLTNGVISLGGNLLVMRLLTGVLHVDPIAANVGAIVLCSLVNFAASDALVFRTAALALALVTPATVSLDARETGAEPAASTLHSATLAAWSSYEQLVDARYAYAKDAARPFFAEDAFGTPGWRDAALGGQVPMLRIRTPSPGAAEIDVPDGAIHHWVGAVFVRGATLERVLATIEDRAGHEAGSYDDVLASRLIGRSGDRFEIYLKLRRSSIITVTYNTTHVVEYRRLAPTRASGRSTATRIAELTGAGTPQEREKPVGNDSGYLWKLNAYWRYEETHGGVLIECESVSLSRSVPLVLRPFISRAVEGIARDALEKTLTSLRRVLSAPPA